MIHTVEEQGRGAKNLAPVGRDPVCAVVAFEVLAYALPDGVDCRVVRMVIFHLDQTG